MFDKIKQSISIITHAYGFKAVRWSLAFNNKNISSRILKGDYICFWSAKKENFPILAELFPYFNNKATLLINELIPLLFEVRLLYVILMTRESFIVVFHR